MADAIADLHEGDEVVEINGIPMPEKTDRQIEQILGTIQGEMEVITRR